MSQRTYSIGDLERLSGIKAHTIRVWEQRYKLLDPLRTDSNTRRYTDDHLKKVLNIAVLNRNGLKISKLAKLADRELNDKVRHVSRSKNGAENLLECLIVAMLEVDEKKFEKIVNASIMNIGFERTIEMLLKPFFERIGVLWQTGSISPAHEHFVSNLVRNKIITAIDSVVQHVGPETREFVLFLPEGELHELGLLFYYYLLKNSGHKVIYLGQSVPLKDLVSFSEQQNPAYFLTNITSVFSGDELFEYLEKLSAAFPNQTLFISGLQLAHLTLDLPANIKVFKEFWELTDIIDKKTEA